MSRAVGASFRPDRLGFAMAAWAMGLWSPRSVLLMGASALAILLAGAHPVAAQATSAGASVEFRRPLPPLVRPSPGSDKTKRTIIEFDIPAQPLERALDAYSAIAGVQLLVDASLLSGLRSTAVKGTFALPVALTMLIAGTGLAVHRIDDQGVTFVRAPEVAAASVSRFERYSAAVQEALRSTLCRYPETTPGSYRALMRLWIDSEGVVFRSDLVTSSGSAVRDAALSKALQTLTLGQPPEGLPQPIILLVTPDEAPAAYCGLREPTLHRDAGLAR